MSKKQLQSWLAQPAYVGIRGAISALLSFGLEADLVGADRLSKVFAERNRKRLGRAIDNLTVAYPQWDGQRVHDTAVAAYSHLFRLGVEVAYAPRLLSEDNWSRHMAIGPGVPEAVTELIGARPIILISGHCGNWELLAYFMALLGFPMHALYRPLDLVPLDRWIRSTRQRRGLVLVDKFGAVRKLPDLLRGGAPIGFVADQNGGDRGVMVPFFGRLVSTYKSIGLLAMQCNATLICGTARRNNETGMRYTMQAYDIIHPEDWQDQPDPLYYLTARYRRAIEMMVRDAPEQYLWMHRIWRSRPHHERVGKPFPRALREKIGALPWITDDDLERIVEHSARDAATLARTGATRLG